MGDEEADYTGQYGPGANYHRGGGGGHRNRRYNRNNYEGRRRNFNPRMDNVPQIQFDPDAEMRAQLRLLLISVGDFHSRGPQSSPLYVNVKGLAAVLEADLEVHAPKILDLVTSCLQDLPIQSGVYAALTALLNQRKPSFARQLLARVTTALKENLASCHQGDLPFTRAKITLRFLAELVNCKVLALSGAGGFSKVLQDLEGIVKDSEARQANRDAAALLLVTSSIWALPSLKTVAPEILEAFMKTLQEYMDSRTPIFGVCGLRPAFLFMDEEEEAEKKEDEQAFVEPCSDNLVQLWKVLQGLMEQGESLEITTESDRPPSRVIIQPWRELKVELEQEAAVHSLPDWEMPSLPNLRNPVLMAFKLFDKDSGEAAAAMVSIPEMDRILIKTYLQDISVTFRPFIKPDGQRIGRIKTVADQMLATAKLVPLNVHMEYLVVETVFELLLQPPHIESPYIHRIMLDLLRSAPTIMPAAMASGTELLFRRLPKMDFVVAKEFATWFAHNLANTGFAWPYWEYWAQVLEAPEDDSQKVFVSTVLETCVKLTFHERIRGVIPESFQALLPPEPSTYSRYLDATDEEAAELGASAATRKIAAELLQMFKDGASSDEVQDFMDKEHESVNVEMDGAGWKSAVFIQVLLTAGSATIAHTRSYMDKHKLTLSKLAETADGQVALVESTAEVWQSSNQMFLFIMEELMLRDLVSPVIVVAWVFSDDCLIGIAAAPFLWDVLCRATTVSIDRVKLAAKAVAAAQRRANKHQDDMDDTDGNEDLEEDKSPSDLASCLEELARNLREAQEVTQHLMARFIQVIGGYVAGFESPETLEQDPWFLAIMSYFRAVCRIYLQAPSTSVEASEVLGQMLDPKVVLQGFTGMQLDQYCQNILAQLSKARDMWAQ